MRKTTLFIFIFSSFFSYSQTSAAEADNQTFNSTTSDLTIEAADLLIEKSDSTYLQHKKKSKYKKIETGQLVKMKINRRVHKKVHPSKRGTSADTLTEMKKQKYKGLVYDLGVGTVVLLTSKPEDTLNREYQTIPLGEIDKVTFLNGFNRGLGIPMKFVGLIGTALEMLVTIAVIEAGYVEIVLVSFPISFGTTGFWIWGYHMRNNSAYKMKNWQLVESIG